MPRPRRAERQAHGDLAAPRHAAHQHEPGDVRARDQQHQQAHRAQHDQRRQHVASGRCSATARTARLSAAAPASVSGRSTRQRGPERVGLRGGARHARCPAAGSPAGRAGRRGDRTRRSATASSGLPKVKPSCARHHHRDEHFDVVAHDRAVERRIGDADDRQRVVVDLDRLADDVGIGAEVAPPQAVAEDDDRMAAGRDLVRRQQRAAELRADAEHLKVVAGDELARDLAGASAAAEVDGRRTPEPKSPRTRWS